MGRHWRALGATTVSTARDDDKAGAIAEITGLTEATVRRRLEQAHGKTLIANLFVEAWPTEGGTDEDQARIGNMTAAAALEQDLAATIGRVVGLKKAVVYERLERAHGKTLVANVFEDAWPVAYEVDLNELARMRTSDARDQNLAAVIAAVTEMGEPAVTRRLEEAHGKTLLSNVFDDVWPWAETEAQIDIEALGTTTTTEAREQQLADAIAKVTGVSTSTAQRRLEEAHGKTLVANVFDDVWPGRAEEYERDVDDLGARSTAEARERNLAAAIAEVTGLSVNTVQQRLEEAHGKMLLANLFEHEWPGSEDNDERQRVPPGQGGEEHRRLQDAIAELGVVRNFHVCTDKQLYAGFRPDVAWFRKHAAGDLRDRPFHVFEIERGGHGALAKSVQSLQLAHDKFNADITLIVRSASLERAREMVAAQFGTKLTLCTVESCVETSARGLAKLAETLKLELGTRR